MKTAEAKTTHSNPSQQSKGSQPFFNKGGEGSFFSKEAPQPDFFFSPSTIQPKLTIGAPNDPYEQEADAMAEKVVQRLAIGDSGVGIGDSGVGGPAIQRKCAACEEEDKVQKKEGEEEEVMPKLQKKGESEEEEVMPKLQRKAIFESNEEQPVGAVQRKAEGGASEASPDLESRLGASRGGGQSLPEGTRSSMESAFGTDFSSVRVHTGSEAVQMNQELGAQAFTHGSDVYFGAGKYDTGSTEGQRLLGHELTHVVQQGGGSKSVQKFSSEEHRRLGDNNVSGGTLITGFGNISFGEMIALGDYFESVEEMAGLAESWGPYGRNQLAFALWKVNPSGRTRPSTTDPLIEQLVMDRFYRLAARNETHFTTGSSAGNSNRERYINGHTEAINAAFSEGLSPLTIRRWNWQAKEGFAQHFLTDGFSGGHIRTPRGSIQSHWSSLYPHFTDNFIRMISCYMASHINARDNVGYFSTVNGLTDKIIPVITQQGGSAMSGFSIGDLISMVLHDADNQGLDVVSESSSTTSGRHHWRAVGDDHLFPASGGTATRAQQQTQQMINAAIQFSYNECEQAYSAGVSGNASARDALLNQANFRALPLLPAEDTASTANPSYAWAASGITALPSNIQTLIVAAFNPGTELRSGLDAMSVPCITTESGFDLHTRDAFLCFKEKLLGDVWLTITEVAIGGSGLCPPGQNDPCPTRRNACP